MASQLWKLGKRVICGLNGSMWHGTPKLHHHIRTIFEDTKHGADMQSSTLFCNFHYACTLEQSVPEVWMIGADNTPKETKNSTTANACIWMLCALRTTRLWKVSMSFLMVGHTHDSLDRFFSRLCKSLKGRDYWTLDDMINAVKAGMPTQDIIWHHLSSVWDWTLLRAQIGIEFHKLRNVHNIEFYRTESGLYCRWKQWMTDEVWSRPLLLLSSQDVIRVGALLPNVIPNMFPEDQQAKILNWLDTIEVSLRGSMQDKTSELQWLRRAVQGTEPTLQPTLRISTMLEQIRSMDGQVAPKSSYEAEFPMDVLHQLFPGSDITGLPVNTLISVDGSAELLNPDVQKASCETGDLIIVAGVSKEIPFHVGIIMEVLDSESALVNWLVPGQSNSADGRGGRKRKVLDVFGAWTAINNTPIGDTPRLPPIQLPSSSVLEWGFELDGENCDCVPFTVLDKICDKHQIDITGLSVSSTPRGNTFRAHRTMRTLQT